MATKSQLEAAQEMCCIKGIQQNGKVLDAVILNAGAGVITGVVTRINGTPTDLSFTVRDKDGTVVETITVASNADLPMPLSMCNELKIFAADHPIVDKLMAATGRLKDAVTYLRSACANDTNALNAINFIVNTTGINA